jgi:CBS domain-containing protein
MKVKEIMTENAKACIATNSLAEAAGFMWENDCGSLPVVAEGEKVVGLITDRDICMAAALKNRCLENIAVEEVLSGKIFSCNADDDVLAALKTMQENKVRRLAVVSAEGTLKGMLSMNDIVLNAQQAKGKKVPELSYADVVSAFKAICAHPLLVQQQAQHKAAGS